MNRTRVPWHALPDEEAAIHIRSLSRPMRLDGATWSQAKVTPVAHHGEVCQGGVSCMSSGNDNRDLYDDFGVAASPVTGLAPITYSDQAGEHGKEPGQQRRTQDGKQRCRIELANVSPQHLGQVLVPCRAWRPAGSAPPRRPRPTWR